MERSVRTGVLRKFVGQLSVQSTRFVTGAVLTRLLEPADYGSAAVAVALYVLRPLLATWGWAPLWLKPTARREGSGRRRFGVARVRREHLGALLGFAGPVGRFLDEPRIGTMVAAEMCQYLRHVDERPE